MKIFQIGVTALETNSSKREIKSVGGIQMYILDLIKYILKSNISGGVIGKIYNYNKIKNFKYIEVQKSLTSNSHFLFFLFFKSFVIHLPENSIVHAHRPDHLAVFLGFKKIKSVLSLHGQQAKTVNDRKGIIVRSIYNYLEKFAIRRSTAIIAVDKITKNYYLNRYKSISNKLIVIPTGIDTTIFKPKNKFEIRENLGFSSNDKIILYVGRIAPPKRIADIIKAFEILAKNDKFYKLIIVGDGVLIEDMKELTEHLNLNDQVIFFGIRKRNELPEIYNMSDISVLYSDNEGSPLAVKESLACGIPVVANRVGDISTIIRNGYNGYLVEKENEAELSLKMKTAIEKASDFRNNCIDSIQQYTTDKVNQEVIDLYKRL